MYFLWFVRLCRFQEVMKFRGQVPTWIEGEKIISNNPCQMVLSTSVSLNWVTAAESLNPKMRVLLYCTLYGFIFILYNYNQENTNDKNSATVLTHEAALTKKQNKKNHKELWDIFPLNPLYSATVLKLFWTISRILFLTLAQGKGNKKKIY